MRVDYLRAKLEVSLGAITCYIRRPTGLLCSCSAFVSWKVYQKAITAAGKQDEYDTLGKKANRNCPIYHNYTYCVPLLGARGQSPLADLKQVTLKLKSLGGVEAKRN